MVEEHLEDDFYDVAVSMGFIRTILTVEVEAWTKCILIGVRYIISVNFILSSKCKFQI